MRQWVVFCVFWAFFTIGNYGLMAAECPKGKKDIAFAKSLYNKPDKDYEKIEAALKQAAEQCPNWNVPLHYMGVIYQERGRHKEAVQYFHDALALDEKDFSSALYLGDSYAALGSDMHAARFYFKGTRIIENDIDLRYNRSKLLKEYTEKRERFKEKTHYVDAVEAAAGIGGDPDRLAGRPKIDTSVEFDTNKAVIKDDWKAQLDTIAEVMDKASGNCRFIIQGHTDKRGTHSDNDALSIRRANSVKNYLVGKGVSASLLSADGKGERRNLACKSNETQEACWRKNRRVVFVSCKENESDTACLKRADAD